MTEPAMTDKDLLYEVAKLAEFEGCDSIWWRYDDGEMSVFALCSDVFEWGSADAQRITAGNIDILRQAVADVAEVAGDSHSNQDDGFLLFAARVRQQRPQGAMYEHLKVRVYEPGPLNEGGNPTRRVNEGRSARQTAALRALFDAAGPERVIDLGNPKDRDGNYKFVSPGRAQQAIDQEEASRKP